MSYSNYGAAWKATLTKGAYWTDSEIHFDTPGPGRNDGWRGSFDNCFIIGRGIDESLVNQIFDELEESHKNNKPATRGNGTR